MVINILGDDCQVLVVLILVDDVKRWRKCIPSFDHLDKKPIDNHFFQNYSISSSASVCIVLYVV